MASFCLTVVSFAFLVCCSGSAEVCGDSDGSCDVSMLQTHMSMKANDNQSLAIIDALEGCGADAQSSIECVGSAGMNQTCKVVNAHFDKGNPSVVILKGEI